MRNCVQEAKELQCGYHSITIGGTALLKHLIEAFSEIDDPRCEYKVGHADVSMTLRAYAHVMPHIQQAAANIMDDIFDQG
jgi:hypothetical protein